MKSLLLFLFIFMINYGFTNAVIEKLDKRMDKADSLVCVGLDPDITKMPQVFQEKKEREDAVFSFLSQIVDITAPHVCAYKVQKAFFDEFDKGHELLRNLLRYIHDNYQDIVVFIDCKIGDIDNTMKTYMRLLFDNIKADGVVINPYMGDDVMEPFIQDKKKVGIVLVQTSNPNAKVVQESILNDGKFLWEKILDLTIDRWNLNKNLIVVLSSNSSNDYSEIRKKIPQEMPILLAGIGSQGGSVNIMKQLLNDRKKGVFVNSSRSILYPYEPSDVLWKEKILRAVLELKQALNNIRNG